MKAVWMSFSLFFIPELKVEIFDVVSEQLHIRCLAVLSLVVALDKFPPVAL